MHVDRLDKILTGSGRYTRSQARAAILSGAVTVDGVPVRSPERKVSRSSLILAKGQIVEGAEHVYYMMNKPAGYLSATEDGAWPAVTALLPPHLRARGLFPVGRLDADVTGLLVLTDDGVFAHRVTAPRSEIRKVYELTADGPLAEADVSRLAAGVVMDDGTAYRPAVLEISREDPCCAAVTVTEGRYHEVKNLILSCGRRVLSMRRVSVGGLRLDPALAPGEIRPLTEEEKAACLTRSPQRDEGLSGPFDGIMTKQ